MSGIVGIMSLDGSPVDQGRLRSMAEAGQPHSEAFGAWSNGSAGLGHAPLHAPPESRHERQPRTLDGQVWISADARIDGRDELCRKLSLADEVRSETGADLIGLADEVLILHAYSAWGERCVEHLLGDFAFAIWDGRRRRLLCARDQLGVKPFFYAVAGGVLVFASDLDCVRRYPGVSDELNDLAVADFLLWGRNQELDSTLFAKVRRLAPGHVLLCVGGELRATSYWKLSASSEFRFDRAEDCVQRFSELLSIAVGDRLGGESAGILMSGGVDSPLVASAALSRAGELELRAHTLVFENLIPDQERRYAELAGAALGIQVDYHEADAWPLFAGWDAGGWTPPEPSADPTSMITIDLLRAISAHSGVALTGYDGDALCQVWLPSHFRGLVGSLQIRRAFADAARFSVLARSLPPIGLRTRLRRGRTRRRAVAGFPPWLDPELVTRLDLRARWERYQAPQRPLDRTVHADVIELLTGPGLTELFKFYDPTFTRSRVRVRHPLLDLRVVDFMLSLPPIPWCVKKTILRSAAAEALPTAICMRPKAPLAEDPVRARLHRPGDVPDLSRASLQGYVIADDLPPLRTLRDSELLWPRLWAESLGHWLHAKGLAR